ncbi:MAG: hypothetical protein V3S29_06250 [bacterium]
MGSTIKAEVGNNGELARFWRQYFQETPFCSLPGCGVVATEVDTHFPYIDDFNRCETHPLQALEHARRATGEACRPFFRESGSGGKNLRKRWRRPKN